MFSLWGYSPIKAFPPEKWLALKDDKVSVKLTDSNPTTISQFIHSKVTYMEDREDQWSVPDRTLRKGFGDCEDFAILARALFLSSGGLEKDCFFLIVYDKISQRDHAVLLVKTDKWYCLDSYTSKVLPIEQVQDYTPKFAYQGEKAWVFGKKR